MGRWVLAGWMALSVVGHARAQAFTGEVVDAGWGVRFTVPDGWVGVNTAGGYFFASNEEKGFVLVAPHEYATVEALHAGTEEGADDGLGTVLRPAGPVQAFGEQGVAADYVGTIQGQPARVRAVGLLNPNGVGVTVMAAVEPDSYTEAYAALAEAVARSVRFDAVQTAQHPLPGGAPEAGAWSGRLAGTRLTYVDSYSADFAGSGYADKIVIDLCSAGHFLYSDESSISVQAGGGSGFSGGTAQGAGQWSVTTRGGQPVLRLASHDGDVAEFVLSYPDEELHLNDRRFFWTDHTSDEAYRPRCR